MSHGKDTIILLTVELIKKRHGRRVKVELDVSNYATKVI